MLSPSRLYPAAAVGCAVALMLLAALVHTRVPPVASTGHRPVEVRAQAAVPRIDRVARQLLASDKVRVERALHAAVGQRRPFLNLGPTVPTVVVPGPGRYSLADLPKAALSRRGPTTILRLPVVVAPDARLRIGARRLVLRSTATVRANVNVVGGGLLMRGTRVRSSGPDTDPSDGRAYVLVQGGHMMLRRVHASHLGFATGRTSGVAWMHRFGTPSTGGAIDSTFTRNLFGVYSSGASGLRFVRDKFIANDVYGFDPHGPPPGTGNAPGLGSNDFLVKDSVSAYNGRHGFIFSSGCHRNRMIDSVAHHNGGSGFVIDDGRPRGGLLNPSNDNLLRGIEARDNGRVGVVIEGGKNNQVREAVLVNNSFGVRVTDAARDTIVADSRIDATRWTALALSDQARASILRTTVHGATVGIDSEGGARLEQVSVTDAVVTGLRLEPTDVVAEVSVAGTGRRTVEGIQEVTASAWRSDKPPRDALTPILGNLRHQVWLLLMMTPVVLWSAVRLRHRVRNFTTRTGL
jgi:hypothetical protein